MAAKVSKTSAQVEQKRLKRQKDIEVKEGLIRNVFEFPCIWDKRIHSHNDRCVVDAAWDDVAEAMNWSKATCKSKWKNLVDQYRNIYRSNGGGSGSGLDDVQEATDAVKWPFYKSMHFLSDVMIRRRVSNASGQGTSNEKEIIKQEIDDSSQPESQLSIVDITDINESSQFSPSTDQDFHYSPSHVSPSPVLDSSSAHAPRKKKRLSDDEAQINAELQTVNKELARKDDIHVHLADYMLELLRLVPEEHIRGCHQAILQVVNAYVDGSPPIIVTSLQNGAPIV